MIDSGFSPALNGARPSGQMKQLAAQVLPGRYVVGATEPFPDDTLDCGGAEVGAPGALLCGAKDEGAVVGTVTMEALPPGRGKYVQRRTGARLVQTALIT